MQQDVATRSALIADILKLHRHNPGSITRNFYRAHGAFSESLWSTHFPKFSDFLAAAGIENTKPEPETSEISGDKWNITLPKTRICTLEQLLEYCKVDLSTWEVERFIVNKWEMGAKNTSDELVIEPLFQVKATLKKRTEILAVRKEIELLKEDAKKAARTPHTLVRPLKTTGNMLEINIPDVHVGKLAWPEETGYEPYDLKIAPQIHRRALATLLDRTKNYKFDQVLFVVGNDLFNSDDIENRTTKGTIVTTDGRYHKTFGIVRRMITESIERLREIAPVKVIMVSGNHDNLSVWHLGDSLECYFHKYTDVEIDNTPRQRKYHQFGKVMLMLTHGDKGKRQDYPLLMATEQPAMFGQTKFREAHTGHNHMTKLDEQHGVRVRVLPALCPPDDWHAENGLVGNQRSAEAHVWNKDEGLIAQVFYNDDAQETIVSKREIVQ
jgi:predicted phosphodiesterase